MLNWIVRSCTSSSKGKGRDDDDIDFDAEARALWKRLNLDPNTQLTGEWNAVDPIYRHPTGGGTIYVGNQSAAKDLYLLEGHGITAVVNCTQGLGESTKSQKIPNYHRGTLRYYDFPISHWHSLVAATDESILQFTAPMFAFIEDTIERGESVLVHCLAGAHRAGTTGCACLVQFANMDVNTAIMAAKRCRPIIDPIGSLPEFLMRLHNARVRQVEQARATATSASALSSVAADAPGDAAAQSTAQGGSGSASASDKIRSARSTGTEAFAADNNSS